MLNVLFMCLFITAPTDQPVVDTATATEQAKMLIKSGAISAIKSENKNSGFKRSRMLEIKLKVRSYTDLIMCDICQGHVCYIDSYGAGIVDLIRLVDCDRMLYKFSIFLWHRTQKKAQFQRSYHFKEVFPQMKSSLRLSDILTHFNSTTLLEFYFVLGIWHFWNLFSFGEEIPISRIWNTWNRNAIKTKMSPSNKWIFPACDQ